MGPTHYEIFVRKFVGGPWTLEQALEDRTRALDLAAELMKVGRVAAVRICKEVLDEESREFKSVTIQTLGDTSEGKKKKVRDNLAPLCVSPQDLYTVHARDLICRLLDGWLKRERATSFELLHRQDLIEKIDASGMDLQHAIQKLAIPEAQDRGIGVHEVIRHYQALTETAIKRVMKDYRIGAFPNLADESFANAAERIISHPERAYLLSGAVANALFNARTWGDKVNILLDLADSAPMKPAPRALAFEVLSIPLSEILGGGGGMVELLGPDLDLGGQLAAMTRLAAADTVDALAAVEPTVARLMPVLEGPAARLANWLEGGKFDGVRAALGQRVLREMLTPRRLRPTDAAEEIKLLRVLAMSLTAAAGKLLPLEQVQEAFTERSQMLVRSDFIEDYLAGDKSAMQEVEALIWLAENVTGAANKRAASRWVGANIGAMRFERDLRAAPDSPASKLAALANVQRMVARVGFVPEELAPIAEKIGDIGSLVESDAKLVSLVAKANAPTVHRLTVLLRLANGEAAPIGPVSERARNEILKLMKAPEARAELATAPEMLEKLRNVMTARAA
jgi:hypothetical protein